MSVIYDALKKLETRTKESPEGFINHKDKNNRFFFLRILAILCILILFGFWVFSVYRGSNKPDEKSPFLYINGILFSDGKYIALINNQMVKAGDYIAGSQIQEIDSSGVEIKFKDSTFRINYPQ